MNRSPNLEADLGRLVGAGNVLTDEADRRSYAYDAAPVDTEVPSAAVRPADREAMRRVVEYCHGAGLPLTVRGAGTNLSGGTVPARGGIVLLTGGLDRILEVNEADLYARVEPGVVTATFAAAMAGRGLFYPPDPGSQAVSTLGGNVAENAGGLRGLKYGVTRDYVLGLEFLAADGTVVKGGGRTVKNVTGFNLPGLMTGSEGTLGVISEITLKLVPPPQAARSLLAVFPSVRQASETVAAIIAARIVPATLEFLDNFTIRTVEDFRSAGLPVDAAALLLIEVDGHPAQVADEAEAVMRICRENGSEDIRPARDDADRARIWQARRDALPALARRKPTCVLEDATVPRSAIPALLAALDEIAAEFRLTIGTFGHAGDGNLHPTILTDRRDAAEWRRVEQAVDAIFERALALGGTLSGEHGIGTAKRGWLAREAGQDTVDYCRRLKLALDPQGILNPGKIVDLEPAREEAAHE